jgi:predicted transport protein
MRIRTDALAQRAIEAWPVLSVAKSLITVANREEMRKLAARQDLSTVKMSTEARALFEELRKRVLALDSDVLELADPNSVSYYGPNFFLEVLPRRYRLALLLPLDFNEIDDPSGLARDARSLSSMRSTRQQYH